MSLLYILKEEIYASDLFDFIGVILIISISLLDWFGDVL